MQYQEHHSQQLNAALKLLTFADAKMKCYACVVEPNQMMNSFPSVIASIHALNFSTTNISMVIARGTKRGILVYLKIFY